MFPVPIFDETSAPRSQRPVGLKLLSIGLAMIFAVSIAALLIPDAGDTEMLRIVIAMALVCIGGGVFWTVRERAAAPQKGKRGLDGLDLYSVIDRLVDDLDDDEAAYLRRRLDARDEKAKDDLTLTVDEMLDQRAQERDSR